MRYLMIGAALAIAAQAGEAEAAGRTAVISAFEPEWQLLQSELSGAEERSINGVRFVTGRLSGQDVVLFLSGVSMVNAAMTTQLALDHFEIDRILVSGIAGGADPELDIGDVVVAGQWGQYLESIFARKTDDGYAVPPFLEAKFPNYGMMFPRGQEVRREGSETPERRFWFPVDDRLLETARGMAGSLDLAECTDEGTCLSHAPALVVGGNGVSGAAFVDNAEFRSYAHETFGARVIEMETAAIAHVAYSNDTPFIAFRSLSDLAGGGDAENEMAVFLDVAAGNAARVVTAYLARLE